MRRREEVRRFHVDHDISCESQLLELVSLNSVVHLVFSSLRVYLAFSLCVVLGQQRAVIEHQQEHLVRQQTTIDAERAARTPVIPIAQDARVNLVDLRVGNKPETFAGETHEWKGWSFKMRQYIVAVDEELNLELVNVEANPLREMPLAGMNEPQKRRARTRKDPNSSAIRCRWCATEVNTGESRSDTFAATPPLKFVRLILSWAATYKPKRANASMIIAVFDISVAFFHGKVRKVIYVVHQRTFARKGRSGDCSSASTELVTRVKCLRRTWRKDSTIMASREMRWCRVCTGAQCWKHLVCTGETISSSAFQMTGQKILNN